MYSPSVGYSSQYVHQHQVPVSRHVGSYNLGVSPAQRLDFASPLGGQPIVQSRLIDGSPSPMGLTPQGSVMTGGPYNRQSVQYGSYGQSPVTIQSQAINSPYQSGVYNPQMKYIGGQSGVQGGSISQQVGGSGSVSNGVVGGVQGTVQQQGQIQGTSQYQQQQGSQQGNIIQQQQEGVASQNQINPLGGSNVAGTAGGPNTGTIDISNTANFENPNFRGGDYYKGDNRYGGPNQFTRQPYDHADREYYDQDLVQTRRRNPGKIVGPHIYSYDDIDNDQRIRKPPDQEHEQKLQKLKSEKTKRELHVQELDYKIHILEQENQSLRNQMEQMKTDYKRLNQVYEEKYSHEIERLHLENQDYENSNKQWASRFKDLVDKCDDLVQEKQDLEDQNRKLNDKILQIQVLLHEQPIKNQMRFENTNKNF